MWVLLLQPSFDFHLHGKSFFFHPLTFSLYVSLGLKWVSHRQHIYGSCFCIHSASLCLLVGAFNPFTFKVIIDMYVPITIFLIVLGLFLFIYIWLRWVFVAVRGLLIEMVSPAEEHGLQACGLSSCGTRAQPLRGTRDPPRPGLKPVPLALAGRFPTTASPGKPSGFVFVGPFLLLCFPLRQVPLAFVVELVWWCWIFLAFACL